MNIDPTALSVASALLSLCAALLFALRAREAEREAAHEKRLRAIAISLVDYASPELRQRYESRGLPRFIGEQLWASVVDTKEERAA